MNQSKTFFFGQNILFIHNFHAANGLIPISSHVSTISYPVSVKLPPTVFKLGRDRLYISGVCDGLSMVPV